MGYRARVGLGAGLGPVLGLELGLRPGLEPGLQLVLRPGRRCRGVLRGGFTYYGQGLSCWNVKRL